MSRKITTENIIERANEKHKFKYDYSKTKYTKDKDKICIICHEHGEFWQRASHHLNGVGCPMCCKSKKLDNQSFIEKANEVHKFKYDYSKVEYITNHKKVCIICPIHGEFWQDASSHLFGCACPKCAKTGVKLTNEEFIEKVNKIHHNYFDYSKVEYINAKTKICIICPRHGEFWQNPSSHLCGRGCPKCKSSKLESIVLNYLNKNNIENQFQFQFKKLGTRSIDFFLPKYKIAIECQGEQHYVPTMFGRTSFEKANDMFNKRKILDKLKYDECIKNGVEMVYFTIPSYFQDPTIDINIEFYKDKKVFTLIDELIEYIKSKKIITKNDGIFDDFYNDVKHIDKGIKCNENVILSKNSCIAFHKCEANTNSSLSSIGIKYRRIKYNTLHIFEDEYVLHKNIVLNKIKHILKFENNLPKIFGRKCIVKEINKQDAEIFLNKFHIQGFVSSTVYLGAFHKETLVAVMSFKNENNYKWDLNRFASDFNYVCCGVGGKLFKYFIRKFNPKEIKSFADKRWTIDKEDNVYIKLGFKYDSFTKCDYRYFNPLVDEYKRFHKFGFRKQILNKKYGLPLTMTEKEMAEKLGYVRIWDCGLIKYVWKNED